MRIGLVLAYKGVNYGMLLQAFATQEVIHSEDGNDVRGKMVQGGNLQRVPQEDSQPVKPDQHGGKDAAQGRDRAADAAEGAGQLQLPAVSGAAGIDPGAVCPAPWGDEGGVKPHPGTQRTAGTGASPARRGDRTIKKSPEPNAPGFFGNPFEEIIFLLSS